MNYWRTKPPLGGFFLDDEDDRMPYIGLTQEPRQIHQLHLQSSNNYDNRKFAKI